MAHIGIAVAAGVLAGLLAGGRRGAVPARALRWWPAVVGGAGIQVLAVLADVRGWAGSAAVLASYALLLAFAGANVRVTGMAVVLCGLALNLTSIAVHGGMPVRGSALVAAGVVTQEELADVDLGPKRHLEAPADRLPALGDVVPVRPLRQVLSIGDLVLAAGVGLVAFGLVQPAGRAGTGGRPPGGPVAGHGEVAGAEPGGG